MSTYHGRGCRYRCCCRRPRRRPPPLRWRRRQGRPSHWSAGAEARAGAGATPATRSAAAGAMVGAVGAPFCLSRGFGRPGAVSGCCFWGWMWWGRNNARVMSERVMAVPSAPCSVGRKPSYAPHCAVDWERPIDRLDDWDAAAVVFGLWIDRSSAGAGVCLCWIARGCACRLWWCSLRRA